MSCGKDTIKWKKAMAIARREYPRYPLRRRRRIAGAIIGGKRK